VPASCWDPFRKVSLLQLDTPQHKRSGTKGLLKKRECARRGEKGSREERLKLAMEKSLRSNLPRPRRRSTSLETPSTWTKPEDK